MRKVKRNQSQSSKLYFGCHYLIPSELFAKKSWWRGLTKFCDSLILYSLVTLIRHVLSTFCMFGIIPGTEVQERRPEATSVMFWGGLYSRINPSSQVVLKSRSHGLKKGSAHYDPGAKSGLLTVFVNKVLLKDSHVHLFMYCLWQLLCYHGRFEGLWQR